MESIEELEQRLNFRFLKQNAFEDRETVQSRGVEKWKNGKVSAEAQELGTRFNEKIQAAYIPPVSIRLVNDRIGYGLFAEEKIEADAYVGEYTGLVRQNDRLYFEPLNNYCYEYPILDSIGRSYVIDATEGNLTRFINHSYKPNLTPAYAFHDGFYHCIFLSLRPIEKGEQLSYDYGKSYWYIREAAEEV